MKNMSSYLSKKGLLPNLFFKHVINTTMRIDLSKSENELLRNMARTKRYNIRKGLSKEVDFREGIEADLPKFFDLMCETCRRQEVLPNPPNKDILQKMWRLFHPKGYFKLFFLIYQNEFVSGGVAITLGDRFLLWKIGWSGRYREIKPNDIFHWFMIKWAKEKGYRYFDFAGIDRKVALKMKLKEPLSKEIIKTPTFFKMGFGGEIIYLPDARLYIPNFLLNSVCKTVCLLRK